MPFKKASPADEKARLDKLIAENEEAKKAIALFEEEYQFRQALAEARKNANMTQADVAAASGLSQQAISRIERNNGGGTLKSIIRYINAIGYRITIEKNSNV